MVAPLRSILVFIIAVVICCAVCAQAETLSLPKAPDDISAEIIQCDPNSCQVSDRLVGSMASLPGCLVDLSSSDGQKLVRQVDNFRKPGTHLQPSGEVKVMYHSWLDQTRASSAKILGFLTGNLERNDRLEVKSTMLPGVSLLPEDIDYAKIAAAFRGRPQEEIDKYGIVMSVMVYEVSGAVYNNASRKMDIDWPCIALAGGKSFLYKSGEESSKCFLMAVYAPIPFCLDLEEAANTLPNKSGHNNSASALSIDVPGDDPAPIDPKRILDSGELISKLLNAYVKVHKPAVTISDAPRMVVVKGVE